MKNNKINFDNIAEIPICLASSLADDILEKIGPYVLLRNLIPKNHYQILDAKNFYILRNKIHQVIGCFEVREHENNTIWELGTVWGPGQLQHLIEKFEQLRNENNIKKAFAITAIEKNAQNFAKRTNGIISKFPSWIDKQRTRDDKYFIEWD